MKKLIYPALILCFTISVNAQTQKPQPARKKAEDHKAAETAPAAVKKSFEAKFPGASNVNWGKENAKEWEAEFTFNGDKISANFTNDGTWVETEKEIKIAELPKAVSNAINKQFAGWTIKEADKTETAKNGTIYEADLVKGKVKKEVAFKENGDSVSE